MARTGGAGRANLIRLLLAAALLAACGGRPAAAPSATARPETGEGRLELPEGFRAELYARGLRLPTALAWGPDGLLYATQLNGAEDAASGQLVRVRAGATAPEALLGGLRKPTGLAWRGEELYLAAGRDVLRTRLEASGAANPTPVVRDLPFNGRSEGQIDLLPDGRLLFEASGDINAPRTSGQLLTLAPGETTPTVLATGLKNAYAYAVDPASGSIYATEIGEETVDGRGPPEEINLVREGGDYGWPGCYGPRTPARNRGGTRESCAGTMPPLATFPAKATPTGLAFYAGADFPPAYRDVLYVAHWNGVPDGVMRVTLSGEGPEVRGEATPFLSGLRQPMDVLPHPEGGLLVLDHGTGEVWRILAGGAPSR